MREWVAVSVMFLIVSFPYCVRADEPSTAVPEQRATVHLMEYRYEPARIVLKAGHDAELTLINDGTVVHEFVSEVLQNLEVIVEVNGVITGTLGVAEVEIPPKHTVVLRFTPNKVGEFPFACHAMQPKDHFKAKMTGVLVIEP